MRSLLLASALATSRAQDDIGFEGLFTDSVEEVENIALTVTGTIPDYVVGTFAQGGPARWTWGDRSFTHILDGFSKLNKYEFSGGNTVHFTAKFPRTGFYTEAEQKNDIPLGVFAQQTDPPLSVTLSEFSKAPNDNNQVNIVDLGGKFEVLSDTLSLIEVDPATLELVSEYNSMQCDNNVPEKCTVTKNASVPLGQMNPGASAHPHMTEDGDFIGLREHCKYTGMEILGKEGFAVYRIKKDQRDTIQDIVHIPVSKTSYTHDFGLAKGPDGDTVIVCAQPIHYDAMEIAMTGTLQKGLVKTNDPSRFYVAPLQFGAKAVEIDAPDKIFFGHQVNSFSTESGKYVIDINKQHNIFFDRYDMSVMRDKAKRDSWPTTADSSGVIPGYQTVTRYTIDINAKTVTSEPLFGHEPEENIFNEHDLFRLHPEDYGKPYCGYWAWQAYHDGASFASWAVVRTELCGEKPTVAAAWYRPNVYPGEASFVPKPGSTDKTEGSLIFKAFDGVRNTTSLVVADAKTMETVAEAVLPINIPFTVHGNWFPGISESTVV